MLATASRRGLNARRNGLLRSTAFPFLTFNDHLLASTFNPLEPEPSVPDR